MQGYSLATPPPPHTTNRLSSPPATLAPLSSSKTPARHILTSLVHSPLHRALRSMNGR